MTPEAVAHAPQKSFSRRLGILLTLLVPLVVGGFLGLLRIEAAEAHVDAGIAPAVLDVSWGVFWWDFFDPGEPDGPEDNYGGMYPPLYYFSIRAFGEVFGPTEGDLRYFSFAAQMVLVLLAWLSFPLFLDGRHPWLRFFLTLAVAAAPAHIWWAQVTKYIHFFTLLQALSLTAAVAFLRKESPERLGLFVLSLLALVYTHYLGFLFVAASFLALGLVLLIRRSYQSLLRLVLSGLVFLVSVTPLFFVILPSNTKLQARGGFPNLDPAQAPYQPVALVRDFFLEFNFGPSLTRDPGALSQVPAALSLAFSGQFGAAWKALGPFLPLLLGVISLGGGLALALWGLRRAPEGMRQRALVIALAPALFMLFSPLAGYVIYFPYIGVGTFCTFLILVMGWSQIRPSPWLLGFSLGILLVFGLSLNTYYRHQDLKYPRMRPAIAFMAAHPERYDTAIIAEWMANPFNLRMEAGALPEEDILLVAADPLSLDTAVLTQPGTVVFLAGDWETHQSRIDELLSANSGLGVEVLESWIGMQKGTARIHAVRFWD
jgi:hypothetical protein